MFENENAGADVPADTNAPEIKPVDSPVETTEAKPDNAGGPDKPKEPVVENDDDDNERKRPSGAERQKRKNARLAAELAETQRRLVELEQRSSAAERPDARPGIDRAPKEDDFKDYFEYRDAKIAWDLKQTLRTEREAEAKARRDAEVSQKRMEMIDAYEDFAEIVRERIPDFDKVVASAASIQVKPEVSDEILASEKSALIQYHLATKPDKVRELNALSGRELAKEIGRLEARLHLPQAKKATEATPPPEIPQGGAAPVFDPHRSDSMDDYVKWRRNGGGGRKASF